MHVEKIEVVTADQARLLVRLARRERREHRLRISGSDPRCLFQQDLSELRANIALAKWRQVPVRKEQRPWEIFDLILERSGVDRPVLVRFSEDASKRFLDDLRSAAKQSKFRLHFHHLLDGMAIIEIEDREGADKRFLESMGVIW